VEGALDKERNRVREKVVASTPCLHPEKCVVNGRNQYGTWRRCLRCKTSFQYTPFNQRMDKTKTKNTEYVRVKGYEDTVAGARELRKKERAAAPQSTAAASTDVKEMQQVLMQSNQQLLAGMTTVMSQAVTPLVAGQQTLLELTQQSMASQTMMMQTVQQGQSYMAETMNVMSQQLRRSLDEEEWDQVQNPPSQLPPS
jgi:hypothetical protein